MWHHGGHVRGQEQNHFSPLGTKLSLQVNSSRKNAIVLTPNMAPTWHVRPVPRVSVLLVCMWRHGGHVRGQEQNHFSPLGTKLCFQVNSSRKNSIVLTPNMAALSRGWKANNSVKMHSLTILKFHCNSPLYFSFAFCASAISTARFVAASTASISALLNPDLSSTCIPAIVVPPGEQTSSFNCNTENKNTRRKNFIF